MFEIIDSVLRLSFNGCICCSLNCSESVFIVKLFCRKTYQYGNISQNYCYFEIPLFYLYYIPQRCSVCLCFNTMSKKYPDIKCQFQCVLLYAETLTELT